MNFETSKKEQFDFVPRLLERITPYVITEINDPENADLFKKLLPKIEPYILLDFIESPRKLFNFLKEHKNDTIIITDDVFNKRKNYLDIILGAVCSNPDSCALWPVYYANEKEFIFQGKIILCTHKTIDEIYDDKKFFYFKRDCNFI